MPTEALLDAVFESSEAAECANRQLPPLPPTQLVRCRRLRLNIARRHRFELSSSSSSSIIIITIIIVIIVPYIGPLDSSPSPPYATVILAPLPFPLGAASPQAECSPEGLSEPLIDGGVDQRVHAGVEVAEPGERLEPLLPGRRPVAMVQLPHFDHVEGEEGHPTDQEHRCNVLLVEW